MPCIPILCPLHGEYPTNHAIHAPDVCASHPYPGVKGQEAEVGKGQGAGRPQWQYQETEAGSGAWTMSLGAMS